MGHGSELTKLVDIMDRLRGPGGCPWDHEQTYASLRRYLLEESYEVADALDRGDVVALREELGDLLFQIVFLSRIGKEDGDFTIEDVISGIAEKMTRRHPHVFGTATADTPEEVVRNWETIKREEKGTAAGKNGSRLDGVPVALPALLKAHWLGSRAAQVGFDWERPAEILDKVEEELGELRAALAAGDPGEIRSELGDLLFSLVMLARRTEVDPEGALEQTNRKFRARFGYIERELQRRGSGVEQADLELMERLWNEAKAREG